MFKKPTKYLLIFFIALFAFGGITNSTLASKQSAKKAKTSKVKKHQQRLLEKKRQTRQINLALDNYSLMNQDPKVVKAFFTTLRANKSANKRDVATTVYTNLSADSVRIVYIVEYHMARDKIVRKTVQAKKVGVVATPKGYLNKFTATLTGVYTQSSDFDNSFASFYVDLNRSKKLVHQQLVEKKSIENSKIWWPTIFDNKPAPW